LATASKYSVKDLESLMGNCCTKEEVRPSIRRNQNLEDKIKLIELVGKASIRFEPRSLVDLAGQVVAVKQVAELNNLPLQAKRCLFSKIRIKHVTWVNDILDQQLLIEVSVALRKILVKNSWRAIPLQFERKSLRRITRLLKIVNHTIDDFDQYRCRQRFEEVHVPGEREARLVCLNPVPIKDLGFAIESTQKFLPYVTLLLKEWLEHWEMIKSVNSDGIFDLLLESELGIN